MATALAMMAFAAIAAGQEGSPKVPAKSKATKKLPGRDLVDAFLRTDFDRIARAGRRESAHGLAPMLVGREVRTVRAAIAAAPYAEDGWQVLLDLARLAGSPDRQLAPPAARAAALIAQTLPPSRIDELEISLGELRRRAAAWRNVALRSGGWPDVRVHAIEVNALLVSTLPATARQGVQLDLVAVSNDPEPEVRRAALELTPQPLSKTAREHTGELLRSDSDSVVAAVAAQVLCGGIAVGDDSSAALAAASPAGVERIRDLVVNTSLPITARLDAAQCLAASGQPEDGKALQAMARTVPRFAANRVQTLVRGLKR